MSGTNLNLLVEKVFLKKGGPTKCWSHKKDNVCETSFPEYLTYQWFVDGLSLGI